jgi:hypothetical protein
MKYPIPLQPMAMESISISNGSTISIPKASPIFRRWRGTPLDDSYGGKTVLDVDGFPVFAELAILQYFQEAGWDGVWVDTYRGSYRVDYQKGNQTVTLPDDQKSFLDRIYTAAGSTKGCWDVFCWREDEVIFAEAKRSGKDQIRPTQIHFLETALNLGLPVEALLLVEWSLR